MELYFKGNNRDKDDYFTIDVVDVRQLKRTLKSKDVNKNPWVFLIQDQNDDIRVKECLSNEDNEPLLKSLSFDDKLALIKKSKGLIPLPK